MTAMVCVVWCVRIQRDIAPLYAELMSLRAKSKSESGKFMVVHSNDGLDEISISASTDAWIIDGNGNVEQRTISPADFGMPEHSLDLTQGGDAEERVAVLRAIFENRAKTPREHAVRDFIILNAAAVIWVRKPRQ